MDDTRMMEQAECLEAALPEVMRHLFTLDPAHPVTDMPLGQLRVCTLLQGGPMSLSEVGENLGISSSAMTQIADRLERASFVERVAEPDDRRVRLLRLTEHGAEIMCARRASRTRRVAEALCLMPSAQRDALIAGLDGLVTAARALGHPEPGRRERG